MRSGPRVFLAELVALALVFAPIPHSNRDEAQAVALVDDAAVITAMLFLAVGSVVVVACTTDKTWREAANERAHEIEEWGKNAAQRFHEILTVTMATQTYCPRTPPVDNQLNQMIRSPFFIGMNLAYQDLFRRYGLDLATTISATTVLIPLVENLYRTNARFRTEYEEIGRGFDRLLVAAMAATGANVTLNKVASKTWENLGKCLKDPRTPFTILGITGWILLYPGFFFTFKDSVEQNNSLGVALNLSLIAWMYFGESLKNPFGPISSPKRLFRSIKECLTGGSMAIDFDVMIDLIYGIGFGLVSLHTIKSSIAK